MNKTTNDYNKFLGSGSITNAEYAALRGINTLKYRIDAAPGWNNGTEVASWAYMYTPVVIPEPTKSATDANGNGVAE